MSPHTGSMAAHTMHTVCWTWAAGFNSTSKPPLRASCPSASTQQHINHLAETDEVYGHQGQGLAPDDNKLKSKVLTKRHHNDLDTPWGFTQIRVTWQMWRRWRFRGANLCLLSRRQLCLPAEKHSWTVGDYQFGMEGRLKKWLVNSTSRSCEFTAATWLLCCTI